MKKLLIVLLFGVAQLSYAQQNKNWLERRKERLNRTEYLYQSASKAVELSPLRQASQDIRAGSNTLAAGITIAAVSAGIGLLLKESKSSASTGQTIQRAGVGIGAIVSITGAFRISKGAKKLTFVEQ